MFSRPYENGHAARVVREGIEFIEAHHEDPFFCYLACMEPHPPSGSLRYFSGLDASPHRLADAVSYYRKLPKNQRHSIAAELDVQRVAKIREMDLHLGSLFDYLERSGAITGITVILTSDHGSTYNYRQVPLLTREITHVPVLVREPGGKATVHDGFVEASTDIYSTVLRLAGIDAPSHAMGRDFLAEDWSPPDRCLVESLYEGIYEVAVRETEWLYIHRCEMEPLTGEIWWDRKLGEYLFRASSFPEPEDSSINLVQTETRAASRLRNHALDHCVQSTRYFDERSFLE